MNNTNLHVKKVPSVTYLAKLAYPYRIILIVSLALCRKVLQSK